MNPIPIGVHRCNRWLIIIRVECHRPLHPSSATLTPSPPSAPPGTPPPSGPPCSAGRDLTLTCAVGTPVAFCAHPTLGFLTLAALVLATGLTLLTMTRTAAREFSPAYATRHLLLALLLLPILFVGPLLIPHLVQADAKRLRLTEQDEDSGCDPG
jgi:hypothetical protein